MIYAFFAPKKSGKSTAARILAPYVEGAIVSFSTPLKELGAMLGLDCHVEKEEVNEALGMSGRTFCCAAGDALRYSLPAFPSGYKFTTLVAQRKIDTLLASGCSVVIDDVRYQDEYDMLVAKSATFIRIRRARVKVDPSHVSELLMAKFEAHYTLANDGDEEEVLCDTVREWVASVLTNRTGCAQYFHRAIERGDLEMMKKLTAHVHKRHVLPYILEELRLLPEGAMKELVRAYVES
jgi:hypothetical protein